MDCGSPQAHSGEHGRKKKEALESWRRARIGRCCGHQAKVCDGPIGRLRSLHQSRGIFSRSPRSIYHYLEITFVCLKFAGPETLLQYWILNAFSHDDDKNTWMRGERDPVVIFLLSLFHYPYPRVQMTRVNSPYSCGVMRKCDSQTRVLRVMDRFFSNPPLLASLTLTEWAPHSTRRPLSRSTTDRPSEWETKNHQPPVESKISVFVRVIPGCDWK